jgi:hypothetical protein
MKKFNLIDILPYIFDIDNKSCGFGIVRYSADLSERI